MLQASKSVGLPPDASARLKAASSSQVTSALTRAWQQARWSAHKLAPAPNLTVSIAWNKKLRLQPVPFAAGTRGLVHQGWETFRPCKQRAVKVSAA